MSELVSIQYSTIRDDLAKHFDRMAGLIEQLGTMGTKFEGSLPIGILVASIDTSGLKTATVAINTLSDADPNSGDVSRRLIEEVKTIRTD